MSTPPLDPEKIVRVKELLQQRFTQLEISKIVGVGRGTVYNIKKDMEADDKKLSFQGPGIRSDKVRGTTNWRNLADEITHLQDVRRQMKFTQDKAIIELGDGNHDVAIGTFSDQHLGSWGTDYRLLKGLTDEMLSTPWLYFGLLGDYGQYAIRLRSVLEVSDNVLPPELQTEFLQSWFDEIWPKVAFATWDNHGVGRQEDTSGESSVKRMLSKKVVYFNGIGHIDVRVGTQIYRGVVSHAFRGNSFLNPVHSLMRYMRFEGVDREFALGGDTHRPGMMQYADGDKERVAINTGSIQTNSGYAKRYFSLTTHPVYPIIVFSHDKHQMTPYYSVARWREAQNVVDRRVRPRGKSVHGS